jgi:pimeloyl-ACP methyl ester carboxylesterase
MVNKTLLSLAIAVSTAGLTACNLSSTADSDAVATDPILAGQPGQTANTTAVVFAAARGHVPVAIDFLFAAAPSTDGTASTADTTPPVTTMINDLAGFSATASIDLQFSAALNPTTVKAGSSVWLIELKSKEDNALIDSLDLASIVASEANPFAAGADQLAPGQDYVAEYVEMDNGATPTIRIHPLKPLDPKTKYIVAITDKLKDSNGVTVVSSSEYAHTSGNDPLVSEDLAPVRRAVKAWEALAGGFLKAVTAATQTQDNVILSYAFTTEANDDILLAMAAPENFIFGLFADTVGLEGAVGADTVTAVATGVAAALNDANSSNPNWVTLDPTTAAGLLATRNTATYKTALANGVAESLVGEDGTNNLKTAYPDPTDYAREIQQAAANGAGGLLKVPAHRPKAQDFVPIRTDLNANDSIAASEIIPVPNTALGLPNATISVQGMLTLPQFMKVNDFSDDKSFSDFWKGSSSVGNVIDVAFSNPENSTPPKDSDDSLNVTYRFPFAQHIEDVKVPVLVTYPMGCGDTPEGGWPTVIFQHGITTDRTSSLGFANGLAAACYATVAMDLPTHGVDSSTTNRNGEATRYAAFNGFNVAGYVDTESPASTPFAAALAGLAALDVTTYAGLEERHGNIALNAQQEPTSMVFTPGSESGNSGDFFINLANMQQSRDHIRQGVMDLLNLNASLENIGAAINVDLNGDEVADFDGKLDTGKVYFVGHSLGAITGLTFAAVNNAIANNPAILNKEINPLKAVVLANPGGQLPKLLENSPSFSARILPGLASVGLTQGMANLEKFFSVFQAPFDSVDPVNFTDLLKITNTPVLMFEMVGGGQVDPGDKNTDEENGAITGLPDTLINASNASAFPYPADTVVPNNANPPLNDVATGLSYLAGTDPLIRQLELATVTSSIADNDINLMIVSKLKEGTHGTISSADAFTVFTEMIGQTASFFRDDGQSLDVVDADQLQIPAAE